MNASFKRFAPAIFNSNCNAFALVAAMRIFSELRKVFNDPSDVVRFTVGELDVVPNAMAVIPGSATFTIDFRHPNQKL